MSRFNSFFKKAGGFFKSLFVDIRPYYCFIDFLGSVILAFTLYNIHSISTITEGGVLGAVLLIEHWTHISPSISGFILSGACYIFGWRSLGKNFIVYSAIATLGFSFSYGIFELFPPLFPQIANMPLVATVIGGILVGFSCGLCVKVGGAPTGDDALAMSISKRTKFPIQWIYLSSDLIVLLLSLSYIPFKQIFYSLITVMISGQVIGLTVKIPLDFKKKSKKNSDVQK